MNKLWILSIYYYDPIIYEQALNIVFLEYCQYCNPIIYEQGLTIVNIVIWLWVYSYYIFIHMKAFDFKYCDSINIWLWEYLHMNKLWILSMLWSNNIWTSFKYYFLKYYCNPINILL